MAIGKVLSATARLLLGAAASTAVPLRLYAQKPDVLRIVCGYPPGGSVDIVARKLAEKLAGRVASQVVVDNKPGAYRRHWHQISEGVVRQLPVDVRVHRHWSKPA